MENPKKRKRSANWDDIERSLLRNCVREYGAVESRRTEGLTNRIRRGGWERITQSFNMKNGKFRGLDELRQQWRAIKTYAKQPDPNNVQETSKQDGKTPDQLSVEFISLDNNKNNNEFNINWFPNHVPQNSTIPQTLESNAPKFYNTIDDNLKMANKEMEFKVSPDYSTVSIDDDNNSDSSKLVIAEDDERTDLKFFADQMPKAQYFWSEEQHFWAKEKHLWAREEHQWAKERHQWNQLDFERKTQEHVIRMENLKMNNSLLKKQLHIQILLD